MLPHADDRGRVAAALAAQRQVADEGVPADARAAKQEQPGNVGDPPAPRADGPQMGVALVHRLPDTPGSPVGIDFHGRHHRTEIRVISFERADPSSGTVRAHIAEHGYPGAR